MAPAFLCARADVPHGIPTHSPAARAGSIPLVSLHASGCYCKLG